MLKKINLFIFLLFVCFITSNVKASDIINVRVNDWYYKIENKEDNTINRVPVMYYKNTYANEFIYTLSINELNINNLDTTILSSEIEGYSRKDLFNVILYAYYGANRTWNINFYPFVQKKIWEILYPNLNVSIVNSRDIEYQDSLDYINTINDDVEEYTFKINFKEIEYSDINNLLFTKKYSRYDFLYNDEFYIKDNLVYLDNIDDSKTYKIYVSDNSYGYLYSDGNTLGIEVFSIPNTVYYYTFKKTLVEEVEEENNDTSKEDIIIEEENSIEENDDESKEENIIEEDNNNEEMVNNDIVGEKDDIIVEEDNNKEETIISEEKEEEKNIEIVNNKEDIINKEEVISNRVNNNSVVKKVVNNKESKENNNMSNTKEDIVYEYNNDNKGALVYSNDEENKEEDIKYQSGIILFVVVILLLFLRKIIHVIKYKKSKYL